MGMGGGGRSTGLFRRPYDFALDAAGATRVIGLRGVPIPVWTTKAFTASWEAPLPQLPLKADLVYHQKERDLKVSGTLQNLMPADLHDVWLFYRDRCYPMKQALAGSKADGKEIRIALEHDRDGQSFKGWAGQAPVGFQPELGHFEQRPPQIAYDPTAIVKQILFHEKTDPQSNLRNYSLRPLDQSWRLREEDFAGQPRETRVREVILYGRLKRQIGPADTVSRSTDQPLPTMLWLDDLPEKTEDGKSNKTWPGLNGTLVQDTYIRVIIPVRPAAD
jgi:hypothetical protein